MKAHIRLISACKRAFLKHIVLRISIAYVASFSVVAFAQTSTKDSSQDLILLDSFIKARGYDKVITFSASNIKQYWIENTVLSQDNLIKILLNNYESTPLKIQLANVNEMQDCKVDIVYSSSYLSFSILNSKLKEISKSQKEDDFINYKIASASFHMEDTNALSFYLQFHSNIETLKINRIIISFTDNKSTSFLKSPGTLVINDSNFSLNSNTKTTKNDDSFILQGINSKVISNNNIYVSDNPITNSIKVKNIGNNPTHVYLGYIPYTLEGQNINNKNNPYGQKNIITKVISASKGSNRIVVDKEPEWKKGCCLVLNAKEDLSDFPNFSFIDGSIQDVIKNDQSQYEIIFDKPYTQNIETGTSVRVQCPPGSTYMYTRNIILQPGEEKTLTSTIKKDNNFLKYAENKFCRGTYYVKPILLSFSLDNNAENIVQFNDFSISY